MRRPNTRAIICAILLLLAMCIVGCFHTPTQATLPKDSGIKAPLQPLTETELQDHLIDTLDPEHRFYHEMESPELVTLLHDSNHLYRAWYELTKRKDIQDGRKPDSFEFFTGYHHDPMVLRVKLPDENQCTLILHKCSFSGPASPFEETFHVPRPWELFPTLPQNPHPRIHRPDLTWIGPTGEIRDDLPLLLGDRSTATLEGQPSYANGGLFNPDNDGVFDWHPIPESRKNSSSAIQAKTVDAFTIFDRPSLVPPKIWTLPPREAARFLIQTNRIHPDAFEIAIDDRDGFHPDDFDFAEFHHSGVFHPGIEAEACTLVHAGDEPDASFIAYGSGSSAMAHVKAQLTEEEKKEFGYSFRLFPVDQSTATWLVRTLWWLGKVRTRQPPGSIQNQVISSASTYASLKFPDTGPNEKWVEWPGFSLQSELLSDYDPCAFVTAADALLNKTIEDRLGIDPANNEEDPELITTYRSFTKQNPELNIHGFLKQAVRNMDRESKQANPALARLAKFYSPKSARPRKR